MNKVVCEVPEAALEDFDTLGVQFVEPDIDEGERVRIIGRPCGQEGYLPAELLKPVAYDLTEGDPGYATKTFIHDFSISPHFDGVLENRLGQYFSRLGSPIMTELIALAEISHQASTAVTVINFALGDELRDNRTTAAVWDNGFAYPDHDAMRAVLEDDPLMQFMRAIESGEEYERFDFDFVSPKAAYATYSATRIFGGVVSLVSDGMRVDARFDTGVDELVFSENEAPQTSGNVVIIDLPHHTEAPRQPELLGQEFAEKE